jgi:nitronate monooxygenase
VRTFWDGIIVLAGAISTGRGIRAAEILGANLAYLGTRFIATNESLASAPYRQMVVDCDASDIVRSAAITGVPANWLRPSLEQAGYDAGSIASRNKIDFGNPQEGAKPWKNVWSAGQGVGAVREVLPVAALVDKLATEYREACDLPAHSNLKVPQEGAA